MQTRTLTRVSRRAGGATSRNSLGPFAGAPTTRHSCAATADRASNVIGSTISASDNRPALATFSDAAMARNRNIVLLESAVETHRADAERRKLALEFSVVHLIHQ